MRPIIPKISSLTQYLSMLNNRETPRLEHCPCGRANPWPHGCYWRKSDNASSSQEKSNAVPIQRYYCPSCKKTCSVLPEYISPNRWYTWAYQELILWLFCLGKGFGAIAKETLPSRSTIRRWIEGFKARFIWHKDALCNICIEFGRTASNVNIFWQMVLKKISLGTAMRLCNVSGIVIP